MSVMKLAADLEVRVVRKNADQISLTCRGLGIHDLRIDHQTSDEAAADRVGIEHVWLRAKVIWDLAEHRLKRLNPEGRCATTRRRTGPRRVPAPREVQVSVLAADLSRPAFSRLTSPATLA